MKMLMAIVLLLIATGCDSVLRHTKDRLLGPVEKIASPYQKIFLSSETYKGGE